MTDNEFEGWISDNTSNLDYYDFKIESFTYEYGEIQNIEICMDESDVIISKSTLRKLLDNSKSFTTSDIEAAYQAVLGNTRTMRIEYGAIVALEPFEVSEMLVEELELNY